LRILQPGSIGRVDDVGIGPGGQGEGVHGREGGLTGPVSSVLTGDCRKPLKHGLRRRWHSPGGWQVVRRPYRLIESSLTLIRVRH
jgi:hypothetical protein